MPTHIIFVVEQLNVGGVATSALRWSEALVKQGYNVSIFCQKQAGNYLSQVPNGVHLEVANAPRALASAGQLKRFLKANSNSVIISSAYTSIFAQFLKPRSSKSWILVPNSPNLNIEIAQKYEQKKHWSPLDALYVYALKKADEISAVSHGAARDVEAWAGLEKDSVSTLYNPACPTGFVKPQKAPHPWLEENDLRTFVTCGRMALSKNYPLLFEAFSKAYNQNSKLRLLVLGEGVLRSELEDFIAKTFDDNPPIQLLGNQPNPMDYMVYADAYVSASQVEGFGNVIVEALATGVPIIATDAPHGPREILKEDIYGQLVPRYDTDALTAALLKNHPVGTPEKRKKRAQEFTAESLMPIFEDILKKLKDSV